jgi:hypothetical protein
MPKQPRKHHSKRFERRVGGQKKKKKKKTEKRQIKIHTFGESCRRRTSYNRLEKSQIGDATAADATTKNTDTNAAYKRKHESIEERKAALYGKTTYVFYTYILLLYVWI